MLPTTVLVDDRPRCIVRATDRKALQRFLRNGKAYLVGGHEDGTVSHRPPTDEERAKWEDAFALHRAGGCDEEEFIGVPL